MSVVSEKVKFNYDNLNMQGDKETLLEFLNGKLVNFPPALDRKFANVDAKRSESDFRIMQWNMLAKTLWPFDPFLKNPIETFDWENYRFWRTLEELIRYDSDIICVEEADFYEEIKPYLNSLGYTSIFSPKFSSPCLDFENNIGPDGPAIFYRKSMFQIINMTCGEKMIIDGEINPQVFIILQLLHKPTNKCIFVVCLHLKSKIKNHIRREAQIKIVLESIKLHLKGSSWMENLPTPQNAPLFMCGDFNGEPFENFYSLIVNDNSLHLKDAYTFADGTKDPTTVKYKYSNGKEEFLNRAIDYIFYNPSVIQLKNYLELPKNDKTIMEIGLPNLNYSSDHLSLVCDFKFI